MTIRLTLVVLAAAVAAACSNRGSTSSPDATSLKVSDITVGRSLNSDKTVADKTDSFAPRDMFYVSVKTDGSAPSATLQAKWTYDNGQSISESTQTISPQGAAVTEFHAESPDGWPAGNYKVEILLNGVPAGSRELEVE